MACTVRRPPKYMCVNYQDLPVLRFDSFQFPSPHPLWESQFRNLGCEAARAPTHSPLCAPRRPGGHRARYERRVLDAACPCSIPVP